MVRCSKCYFCCSFSDSRHYWMQSVFLCSTKKVHLVLCNSMRKYQQIMTPLSLVNISSKNLSLFPLLLFVSLQITAIISYYLLRSHFHLKESCRCESMCSQENQGKIYEYYLHYAADIAVVIFQLDSTDAFVKMLLSSQSSLVVANASMIESRILKLAVISHYSHYYAELCSFHFLHDHCCDISMAINDFLQMKAKPLLRTHHCY